MEWLVKKVEYKDSHELVNQIRSKTSVDIEFTKLMQDSNTQQNQSKWASHFIKQLFADTLIN